MTEKKNARDIWVKAFAYDLGIFLLSLFLMFALALVHKDIPGVPPVGYWAAFGLVWSTSIAGALLRGMRDTK